MFKLFRRWRAQRRCIRILQLARDELQRDTTLQLVDAIEQSCKQVGASRREQLAALAVAPSALWKLRPLEAARLQAVTDVLKGRA